MQDEAGVAAHKNRPHEAAPAEGVSSDPPQRIDVVSDVAEGDANWATRLGAWLTPTVFLGLWLAPLPLPEPAHRLDVFAAAVILVVLRVLCPLLGWD